jgi:mRNA interferase RelE/StbE
MSSQARRSLRVPDAVARTICGLHPKIKRKLRGALEAIAGSPRVGKPLKEELAGSWSLRVGRFRVIYRMGAARTMEIVAFGPRERVYEETLRLIGQQAK